MIINSDNSNHVIGGDSEDHNNSGDVGNNVGMIFLFIS